MGDGSDWGWGRDFGGDMGVGFERLEVPLEAKRERLEGFIVVELYVSERVKRSVSRVPDQARSKAAVLLPFRTMSPSTVLVLAS